MYLAGVYFGSFLFVLFLVFLILPILSSLSFFTWIFGIEYEQSLNRYTPTKGDTIDFRLSIRNRSFLPIPNVRVSFSHVSEALRAVLDDFGTYLPARRSYETTNQITCPYRGSYQIGVSEVVFQNQLGLFRFHKRVDPITVTVYPRILNIPRFAPVAHDIEGSGRYASAGILPDTTLFHQLKEYRDGDSIRHIYWKKYASTGKPYLKEYDRTKRAGVRIYFDARPNDRWDINRLEQEDVSVEALVAIVRYLLLRRVQTSVLAGTNPPFVFSGDDIASFENFYQSTAQLTFIKGVSPGSLFQTDLITGLLESQTCVFITHNLDPHLFSVTEGSAAYDTIFLLNRAGVNSRRHDEFDSFAADARRRGRNVINLRSSQHIMADLTGHALAYTEDGTPTIAPGVGQT